MKSYSIKKRSINYHLNKLINDAKFNPKLGVNWYKEENMYVFDLVNSLPLKGLISKNLYCAVTSILSPANSWGNNKWEAYLLVLDFFGISENKGLYRTYQTNVDKAKTLLKQVILLDWNEERTIKLHLDKPTSKKTFAFYNNLAYPYNNEFLTIDRHILKACGINDKQISPKNYEQIELYIKEFWAKSIYKDIELCAFQALIWCNYLYINNKPYL